MYPVYEFSYALEDLGFALIPTLLSRGALSGLLNVAAYVLSSLALYTVAKRRCIDYPWLAWVPVVNCWLLGSLSDQYRYVVKGQIKSRRKVLLMLKIASAALTVSLWALLLAVGVQGVRGFMYGMSGSRMLEELAGPLLGILGVLIPLAGVSVAAAVIRYLALYDVYTSCDPDNNVLFIVLSILFGKFTEPFFLFFSREKDKGMPPRREEPAWQPEPQPQQPWDNAEYE